MAQRFSWFRRSKGDEVAEADATARAADPPPAETLRAPVEAVEVDPGAEDVVSGPPVDAPEPTTGDVFRPGSPEDQAAGGSIIDRLTRGGDRGGFDPDLGVDVPAGPPDLGGVAPAGTEGIESRFDGGAPTMPDAEDLGPTRPETPGLDEARENAFQDAVDSLVDQVVDVKQLDDGSTATVIDNPLGSDFFIVETNTDDDDLGNNEILTGDAAIDHIAKHIPLEPIPTGEDVAEPGFDERWRDAMAEDLEAHTRYGEIRMDALKGSEVNPDPTGEGSPDAALDPSMDPSGPDFADPVDEPVEPVDTIDPADLDPGTIDPIE